MNGRDDILIEHYKKGWGTAAITQFSGLSQRTVQRVIKKYKEEQERVCNNPHPMNPHFWNPSTKINTPALETQVDGDHYKKLKIQPVEYIHGNNIGFSEGNAITYLTRWRDKGGIKDLEKAIHTIQLLIELENKEAV